MGTLTTPSTLARTVWLALVHQHAMHDGDQAKHTGSHPRRSSRVTARLGGEHRYPGPGYDCFPAALALATAACVAVPGAAVAATPAANAEPSSNWAGYAASGA